MQTVAFAYQNFGPYHLARLTHARNVFQQSGMHLVPLQLFGVSDIYKWDNAGKLDGAISIDLTSAGNDSMRYRDMPGLFRALAKLRPAAVFVNGWSTRDAIALHAWCASHRVPRVLVSDSTWEDRPRNTITEYAKKLVISGCGAAFAGGQPQKRYLKRLGFSKDKICLGCDVIDNRHFALAEPRSDRLGRRLLTVARFEPEKNLVSAARAFLRFAATRSADEVWQWTLVGYGSQDRHLRQLASTSRGKLSIESFKTYEELPLVYANADLYFQPSISEPWGLVVNEAMAAGLPQLISQKCGCAEDLVSPEVGWVFDPTSEETIVTGLQAAALGFDRWQTMGEAAAARIGEWGLERFSNGAVQAARIALGLQSA